MDGLVNTIRVAGFEKESYTDGIGIRYTIFVQGCKHNCLKCHNPETWDFKGGADTSISGIVDDMIENPLLDGVTISGGDPMYRCDEVLSLIEEIKARTKYNIWAYTGFTYEECLADSDKLKVLSNIDVLVDGEYKDELRSLSLTFRGSSNQRIIDVQKSLKTGEVIELELDSE